MPDEIENDGVEVADEPVAGIHEAITDEVDPSLKGADTDETPPVESTEVDKTETATGTDPDSEDQQEAAAAKAPTLPQAHRRSLKAYGWDDAEIDQNLAALGPAFLATAARIHKNRNDEVSGYAAAGRNARQQQNQPAAKPAEVPPALKAIDVDALKKKYGEAELIDALTQPYNALLAEFQKYVPIIQQTQQRAQQAELETLSRQIDTYFGGQDKDTYGDVNKPEVIENRNKVLEVADAIMTGMKVQGRSITLNDALDLALDSVSGDSKEQKAVAKLKGSLQTRNKGISLRPSGKSSTTLNRGKVKNRADLENKVSRGLAAIFPQT